MTSEKELSPLDSYSIRNTAAGDLPGLKAVIDAAGLFPSSMLDGMIAAYLNSEGKGEDLWLTCEAGTPVGVVYCAPERMTSGTWNMLLIAMHPQMQRRGKGSALVRAIEQAVEILGGRILLVETSGLPDFERARSFYRKLGYSEEARIRDFYQAGEDKIVFRKALSTAGV